MDKKERLIHALQEEKKTLSPRYLLVNSMMIRYLQTGERPSDWEEIPDLYAVVEDFDQVCSDYGIE